MKLGWTAAFAALALVSAPLTALAQDKKVSELSAADLSALQSRQFAASYEILFPSVMSTLQSLGYMNVVASRDAGTASAETEAKGKVIYNIIWGFGKKKRTQRASIFMEPLGPGRSTMKLNLTLVESKSRGLIGSGFSDGQPIKVAEPYQAFYAALDAEVARRSAAAAATPVPMEVATPQS